MGTVPAGGETVPAGTIAARVRSPPGISQLPTRTNAASREDNRGRQGATWQGATWQEPRGRGPHGKPRRDCRAPAFQGLKLPHGLVGVSRGGMPASGCTTGWCTKWFCHPGVYVEWGIPWGCTTEWCITEWCTPWECLRGYTPTWGATEWCAHRVVYQRVLYHRVVYTRMVYYNRDGVPSSKTN